MKKIIAVMLALSLLLVAPPVSAASDIRVIDETGDGVWHGDTWRVDVYPGEMKSTTLTLHNSSNNPLDVEVTIIPDSLDNGNLTFELDKSSFTISDNDYADVTLTVRANGSVTPGTYAGEMRIETVSPPSVTTNAAWPMVWRSAILRGSLDSLGTAKTMDVYFEWGKTMNYGNTTRVQTIRQPRPFVAIIKGLEPGTTYHFRAVAVAVGDGTSYGEDMSFTTREGRGWKVFRFGGGPK